MKTVTTIEDLINYLKVGDANNKTNQEVLIKKITQEPTFKEETISFQDFGLLYKIVEIPQTLYLDKDNRAFVRQQYTTGVFIDLLLMKKTKIYMQKKRLKITLQK